MLPSPPAFESASKCRRVCSCCYGEISSLPLFFSSPPLPPPPLPECPQRLRDQLLLSPILALLSPGRTVAGAPSPTALATGWSPACMQTISSSLSARRSLMCWMQVRGQVRGRGEKRPRQADGARGRRRLDRDAGGAACWHRPRGVRLLIRRSGSLGVRRAGGGCRHRDKRGACDARLHQRRPSGGVRQRTLGVLWQVQGRAAGWCWDHASRGRWAERCGV